MNNNFKGLILIISGMSFFIVQDTLIKLTEAKQDVCMVSWRKILAQRCHIL